MKLLLCIIWTLAAIAMLVSGIHFVATGETVRAFPKFVLAVGCAGLAFLRWKTLKEP